MFFGYTWSLPGEMTLCSWDTPGSYPRYLGIPGYFDRGVGDELGYTQGTLNLMGLSFNNISMCP